MTWAVAPWATWSKRWIRAVDSSSRLKRWGFEVKIVEKTWFFTGFHDAKSLEKHSETS